MKIIIYECRDPTELPDLVTGPKDARVVIGKPAFMARIRCTMPSVGGGSAEGWHPVIFEAPTIEAARTKAQAWWDAEMAKVAARDEAAKAKKPAKAAAPIVEAEEEEAIG